MNPANAKIRADLARHMTFADLTQPSGQVGNVGEYLCSLATDGVREIIDQETDPDGSPWPPLSEAYDEWKQAHFPGQPMAKLYGIMAQPEEIAGETFVQSTQAAVIFGKSDEARQEFEWFNEGGGNRPPRRCWGLTANSIKDSTDFLDDRFKSIV